MFLPYEPYVALRYLRFHRGRTFLSVVTLISVAGVTVGTAAMVIALALMTGFELDIRQRILSGAAHLTVMSSAETTFGEVGPVLARITAFPGVKAAAPVLFSQAMLVNEEIGAPAYVELLGVDPQMEGRVISLTGPGGDPLAALASARKTGRDGIVLGQELAVRLAARRGDLLRVVVPRVSLTPFSAMPRSRLLEVVGTVQIESFGPSAERAYVTLPTASRLLAAEGRASWVEARLDDFRDLAKVKAALRQELGPTWSVVDLLEQNKPLLKALNTEKFLLFLAIALIVVVASLNIVSTLILMVTDKVREIGTLTALGARPLGIAKVFVLQGLIIGVVGTGIGLAVGTSLAWWLDRYRIIGLNPDVYYISHVPFTTRGVDVVFVAVVVLLVSLVATLYPAWKAAALDPVEAIRYE